MPLAHRNPFFAKILIFLVSLPGLTALPAAALEMVAPGETVNFLTADNCTTRLQIPNLIDALARAHAECSSSQKLLKAEVRPISGPAWIGLQTIRATATLWNDFDVSADSETLGNTVGAWVTYDAHWSGRVLFVGFFSTPTMELAIRLRDLTDSKVIKGEIIRGRDGKGVSISIPYIPFDLNLGGSADHNGVSNVFSAVLTRGHRYRVEMILTCSVFSDGGLDVGSECDYMDDYLVGNSGGGAGWSKLAVKVGLDETETLRRLDSLAHHMHTYLTGKGVGHNNTEAITSPPNEEPGSPAPTGPGWVGIPWPTKR